MTEQEEVLKAIDFVIDVGTPGVENESFTSGYLAGLYAAKQIIQGVTKHLDS